jgi:hypothetical protein
VFHANEVDFEARIVAGVGEIAPRATLRRLDAPPVLGAALLGLDRLDGLGSVGHAAAGARLRAALEAWQPTNR